MTQTGENLTTAPTAGNITPVEAAACLRAVLRMFDLWQLSVDDARVLLGQPSLAEVNRWRAGDIEQLSTATTNRLGDLIAIHMALGYLFMEPGRRYEWVKKPNQAFNGKSALQVMMEGSTTALTEIRVYLEMVRGPIEGRAISELFDVAAAVPSP